MEVSGPLHTPAVLPPGEKPIGKEAGWAPEPIWTRGGGFKCVFDYAKNGSSCCKKLFSKNITT
jgi:hypothetical protein